MATIIAVCSGCGKEVPMEIDITEEKFISNVMKDGTTCEACMLLRQNDECYFGRSIDQLLKDEGAISSVGMSLADNPSFEQVIRFRNGKQVTTAYDEDAGASREKLTKMIPYAQAVEKGKQLSCKPGGMLRVRRTIEYGTPPTSPMERAKQLFTETKYADFSLDSKLAEVRRVFEEDEAQ